MVWTYTLIAVLIVSLLSLVGVITLAIKKDVLKKILLVMVAFSAGALIGDAVLHLLPHAIEETGEMTLATSVSFLSGILLFFVLEKFLRWRHCHDVECDAHPKHLGTMNLVGDGVHNFIDGVLIGTSFLVSIPLGIATTVAVIAHEIPQELGDFGVLLHSGFKAKTAVLYNLFSAAFAIVGAVVALLVGEALEEFVHFIIPLTAGGFIYIALSGLVPELHKENKTYKSLIQLIALVFGILVMYLLSFTE